MVTLPEYTLRMDFNSHFTLYTTLDHSGIVFLVSESAQKYVYVDMLWFSVLYVQHVVFWATPVIANAYTAQVFCVRLIIQSERSISFSCNLIYQTANPTCGSCEASSTLIHMP